MPPRPPQLGSKDEAAKAAEKARELLAREPDNDRASVDTDMFSFGGEDDPSNRPPTKGVRTKNHETKRAKKAREENPPPLLDGPSSARSNPTSHSGWVCFI